MWMWYRQHRAGDFYKQMYGAQISEEEMDMMKDVAKEVGIYEAD